MKCEFFVHNQTPHIIGGKKNFKHKFSRNFHRENLNPIFFLIKLGEKEMCCNKSWGYLVINEKFCLSERF